MVITSLQVGQVILLEASLSFLGLGLPVGEPAWGIMVSEGKAVILDVWWLSLLPGLAITAVVLAFNFFGDWMRDALEPVFKVNSCGPEPFEHEMNHSDMDPSLRTFRQSLIVFAEPSIAAQPPKGALDNPPAGQHLKAMAVHGALDHLNQPASQGGSPIHQMACVGSISPDQLEPWKFPQKLAQDQLCAITVLNVRSMYHHSQQQS
jgi:hypothetical protein